MGGAYRKVTSGELLTTQETRKTLLYTNNMYILKTLINVVIAGIEELGYQGRIFCMPASKKFVGFEPSHTF
jgi:hypothetical protein